MKGFLPFLKPFRPRLASNSQKGLTGKQNSQKIQLWYQKAEAEFRLSWNQSQKVAKII
jgi:hypothetical protein